MKNQILETLKKPSVLSRVDIFLTLVPALIWLGGIYARPWIITKRCVANGPHVASCSKESVISLDRMTVGLDIPEADKASDVTQNLAGVLASMVPIAWHAAKTALGRSTPAGAMTAALTDLVMFAQTAAWNGALTETTRLIFQRPRPFVYANGGAHAQKAANYTSFYSGHTSFAAAASVCLLLVLLSRGASFSVLLGAGFAAQALIFLTGMLRVLAGRHFISDVITGAIAGSVVALAVAYFHKPRRHY